MHAAGKSGSADRECVMIAKARHRCMALAKKPPLNHTLSPARNSQNNVKAAESAKTTTLRSMSKYGKMRRRRRWEKSNKMLKCGLGRRVL